MTDEELRAALARFAMNPYWNSSTGNWSIHSQLMWGLARRRFVESYADKKQLIQYRITPEGYKFLAGD